MSLAIENLEPFHVKGPTLAGCNGNGTLAHHPAKHAKAVEMLSHPWNTVHQIALETNLDPSTVAGISVQNVESIQANREALRTKHSLIGRMSADLILHRLINTPDQIDTKEANFLYGTSTDKDMAERGLPTAHIQVTHTLAQDIITPLHDILAQVKSMLTPNPAPALGSVHVPGMDSTQPQRQLKAAQVIEVAPEHPDDT